jgi:hypothetical protein
VKRARLNFLIDAVGFIGFVLLTATGVLMRYVLPPGSGRRITIWGLDRHGWGAAHFWIAIAFFAVLAFHVWLHWRWIVCLLQGRPREGSGIRLGLGILGIAAVLALASAPFMSPVQRSTGGAGNPALSSGQGGGNEIRGSMTLRELEQSTQAPASYIIKQLGLPPATSLDEQLGRLGRSHGFEMGDVRRIVQEYVESQ